MKKFLRNEGGAIAVNFAFVSGAILLALAAGIDMTVWQSQSSKLQDAADTGALSGALMLGNGGRNVEAYSEEQAEKFARKVNDTSLPGFESTAIVDALAETVEVNLSVEVPRIFSHLISKETPRVNARSVAKVVRESVYCIYALNPTASGAISGNGNAVLQGVNCSIQVNSIAPDALTNSGTITADHICVAGGVTGAGYTPTPSTGCPIVADPMADVFIPSSGLCDFTNYMTTASVT